MGSNSGWPNTPGGKNEGKSMDCGADEDAGDFVAVELFALNTSHYGDTQMFKQAMLLR